MEIQLADDLEVEVEEGAEAEAEEEAIAIEAEVLAEEEAIVEIEIEAEVGRVIVLIVDQIETLHQVAVVREVIYAIIAINQVILPETVLTNP